MSSKRSETKEDLRARILIMLAELTHEDPEAMLKLVEYRVPVNDKLLALDTEVVVQEDPPGVMQLGLLGIINGILGNDHRISVFIENNGTPDAYISSFQPYVRKDRQT